MIEEKSTPQIINKFGFYISILLSVLTLGTFIVAFLTPPLSGPFCQGNCFEYPYLDITSRWPRDYIWMFPAMILTLVYIIFFACIHYFAEEKRKLFSLIALIFASFSGLILITDYFIQISVIQPSLINGETDGISILTQYNPHGLFIVLEELGYILMAISFLFIAFAFAKTSKAEKAVRWVFITGFLLSVISLLIVCYTLGIKREYIFEIVIITIDWFVLIIAGSLIARVFKRNMKNKTCN
ncbi:MAG: hypothetical protein AB7S50_07765 [Bacteroidales bacterium]